MRILHTSDWHLGKMLYGRSMLSDQQHFIQNVFIPEVDRLQPDLIILAGDIFDRQVAPPEAIRLFDLVTEEICFKRNIKMAVITGNHDGADRVSVGLSLLRERGLHICNHLDTYLAPVDMEDASGSLHIYMLPYFEPGEARLLLGDDTLRTYEDAYRAILDKIRGHMNPNDRNILAAHCFVAGSEISSSESPFAVGGSGEIGAHLFEGFDYVALGHLHGAQAPAKNTWYSGTPLKFSFDEEKHQKCLLNLDFGEKGQIHAEKIPVRPLRDMRKIAGTMDEIIEGAKNDPDRLDYIYAEIESDAPLFEPMQRLREYYPNILGLKNGWLEEARTENDERTNLRSLVRDKKEADLELFTAFIRTVGGREADQEEQQIFAVIMRDLG